MRALRRPFGPNFNALGIRVSLKHFVDDWVEFANTESPVSEVCGIIKLVVESGELRDKDAIRLRGRLQFANGQLFGRLGKLCSKAITDHACNHKSCKISNRCRILLALLCSAECWKVESGGSSVWLRVQTGSALLMHVLNRNTNLGSAAWVASWLIWWAGPFSTCRVASVTSR